jgi:hypothetical protein
VNLNNKSNFKTNFMRVPSWAFLIIGCLLAEGCLFSGRVEAPGYSSSAKAGKSAVRLSLMPVALIRGEASPLVKLDSVHIRVTGEDMDPLEFGFSGDSLALNLQDLPAGPARVVQADLFRSGHLLYSGKGTYAFRREARAEISLRCDPQFSRVTAQFHLPLGLPMPIADGSLRLAGKAGEFTAKLRKQGEFGSFIVDELPGDMRYDVTMALADGAGKTRYEANRAAVFLPLGEEAKWDLSLLPTEVQAGVALSLMPAKVTQFQLRFPSVTRKPKQYREVVISEFYPAPVEKDSGSAGEWFELFNRTADTLSLMGCRLSRGRSGGVTQSLEFDSTQTLPPGQAMVFGRSAMLADVIYHDFIMVNTSSSLLLLCSGDALVVDSLKYSATLADSLAPSARSVFIKEGWVTSLNADSLGRGDSSLNWCLSKPVRSDTGGLGDASPKSLTRCGH